MVIPSGEVKKLQDLDLKLLKHLEKDVETNKWKCTICKKVFRDKTNAKEHVEIHFDGLKFPCSICDVILRSRNTLRFHIVRYHKSKK